MNLLAIRYSAKVNKSWLFITERFVDMTEYEIIRCVDDGANYYPESGVICIQNDNISGVKIAKQRKTL